MSEPKPKMGLPAQHLLLFGDQTVELYTPVQKVIYQSRTSPVLRTFLRDVTDAVQIEVALLDPIERASFLEFSSILGLAQQYSEKEDEIGIAHCVLVCIARIGELILHAEDDPSILGFSGCNVLALGFCAGLLPAAVAAASQNTTDIVRLGVEIVTISCRLAAEMSRRSRRIEEEPGCWGHSLIGVPVKDLRESLQEFHRVNAIPIHRRAYIGVEAQGWSTVFGSPSVLAKLFAFSSLLSEAPKLKLRAYGAVHAPHLPMPDLGPIIGHSPLLLKPLNPNFAVLSSSSCAPFLASDLRSLLFQMMPDILQNTLDMTGLTRAFTSRLSVPEKCFVQMSVMGPTAHQPLVHTALKHHDIKVMLVDHAAKRPEKKLRGGSELVAIVGMSGRFPGSDSVSEFWKSLLDGQDFHKKIPSDRFDIQKYYDDTATLKNSTSVPYGCFLDKPGDFDARLFNISPREALQMDPVQRILLMVSYEALEMAGYTENGTVSTNSKRISTYFGQASDDWRDINHNEGVDMYYIPGIERGFAPGRMNYHYKWEGASYAVDSACASSASAVGLACDALLNRDCDTAVAGGGTIISSPDVYVGLSRGGFLSSTGGCKTFSDKADGYCRGEGVGVVVLKRLEDAVHDNDNVLAVIRGHGRNHSAHATSITHPHAETQERLYKQVLQQASVESNQIGYVEMHGTATEAGDFTEITSVTNVLGKGRTKQNPLIVGAVKANIGHGEASAGISALIKSVMILNEGVVPPQPGAPFLLNPTFPDLAKMHVRVADQVIPLAPPAKGDGKKRLLLNNFDAAGGNVAFVIEEPPVPQKKGVDPRAYHIVATSARTPASFEANKKRLLSYLLANPEIRLSDLAYTSTARRMHEVLKAAYHGQSIQEIAQQIRTDLAATPVASKPAKKGSRENIVFVFTGQGSQYAGMGKELFHTSPVFRESILSLEHLCASHNLPSFWELIAESNVDAKSMTTVQVQLAIVALEISLATVWKSWGIQPNLVIGHSLGEYSSLCVSGVLSISDTLYLVGKRALMMQERCTAGSHAMLAISSSREVVQDFLTSSCLPSCQVACENAPNATVVSGTTEEIQSLHSQLQTKDIRTKVLQVPYGFHSAQLDPILEDFEACAQGINFNKPRIPVASTLKGLVVQDVGTFNSLYLTKQAREAVQFVSALQACKANSFVGEQTIFIELGPDPIGLGLIRSSLGIPSSMLLPSIKSGENNWKTISAALARIYQSKLKVNWSDFHKPYAGSLTLIKLPTYSFDVKDYWVTYTPEAVARANISSSPSLAAGPIASTPAPILSTCLQRVESESFSMDKITVSFSSQTSEPNLAAAITGHLISGVAMCPSGVFAEMAYKAGRYIYEKANTGYTAPAMSLWELEINHPVIFSDTTPEQLILTTATKDLGTDWVLNIKFSSKNGPDSAAYEVGGCQVRLGDAADWRATWNKTAYFVKSKADALVASAKSGYGHHLQKPIVYKLFSSLVEYGPKYQGIQEAYLTADFMEAVGNVRLVDGAGAGVFVQSPYWTDQLVHLAGFMLNGNFAIPDNVTYIATAIESLQIGEELSSEKLYTSYVRIQESHKKGWLNGDVYVFEGDRVVALCSGLKFQMLPKAVLDQILGKGASKTGNPLAKKPVHAPQPIEKKQVAMETTPPISSSPKPATASEDTHESNIGDLLLAAVATETGIDYSDMDSSTQFADIGVDSLMSIAIISAVKNQTGIDLGASFFNENPTVADVKEALGKPADDANDSDTVLVTSPRLDGNSSSNTFEIIESGNTTPPSPIDGVSKPQIPRTMREISESHAPSKPFTEYSSNVVLVQGRASSKQTPLFLICDGAGSATAYIHLTTFGNGMRVYALESPFLYCPQEYTTKVEETAQIYLSAIRKTQPKGPYMIGGWSAGAVFAYEVSRLLLEAGETILGLILIDMRVPRPMPDLLEPTIDFIENVGLATGINRVNKTPTVTSERLKKHLLGTIKSLMVYDPLPLHPSRRPNNTTIIWAKLGLSEVASEDALQAFRRLGLQDGVEGNVMEDEGTGIGSWFYSKRKVFGANGWDNLLGDVECHAIEADHFSLVVPPHVKHLGKIMKEAIAKFTK